MFRSFGCDSRDDLRRSNRNGLDTKKFCGAG
ncbi:hypothetical protein Goshw_006967 [Gossypium schwendimanii]|uniref:Uncharacterized protein n=1 Tax=Gossypium schwendimanii TaxID=34291 RepID=A0A7J9MS50_GOSSC|nr:hypothetical protein [Gossypium schwendimanii]